jgi:hypothetical protein
MKSVHKEIVVAFETGDELAIRRLGWWEAWQAAAEWWAPKQTCSATEFVSYARLLADEDPIAVLEAFRSLAGEWRPHPAAVYAHLHRSPDEQRNLGLARDRASTTEALAAAAAAHRTGEQPCSCAHHGPTWRVDMASVLRCPSCGGLEPGQLYQAEDAGLIEEEAA